MSVHEKSRAALFKKPACWLTVLLLLAGAVALGGSATRCAKQGGGLSVELTVWERAGAARRSEPVTSGVPVAQSRGLMATDKLGLFDAGGRQVPAQFTVTSRWGGAPSNGAHPIRWLLVDFQATVPAHGSAVFTLREGGTGNAHDTGLEVTRNDGESLDVSTGAAQFAFSKRAFRLFESVRVAGRQVVAPGGASGITAVDASGRSYSSAASAPSQVALETDGPMRKTVRVRGVLSGASGVLLDYTARISLFAGSTDTHVSITVNNRREPQVSEGQPQLHHIGCPNSAVFRDLTARLDCAPGGFTLGDVEGGPVQAGALKVYQDSSGTPSWDRHRGNHPRPQSYVAFRGYRTYVDGTPASSGNQAEPWMDCSGEAGGAMLSVRDFWQNFPKALRAGGAVLEASLFPDEYAGDYSFRPLEQKTHELLFAFHGPGVAPGDLSGRARSFQSPLFAAASPGYYLSTGALGRAAGLTGDAFFDAYEGLNRSTLEGEPANLYRVVEDADFYSWQDFGDVPVDYEDGGTGTLNVKYNFDLGMLLQFARTGDARWLELARAAGRHAADLDVLHCEGQPDVWWEGGFIGHSYHDETSNTNPNRNEGGPHPDLAFGAPGLFMLYYLTGYRPGYDAAVEISRNIRYRFDNSFGRGNDQGYANAYDYENDCESARPFAHGLWVLVDAFRATGDESYMETAAWLIENAHLATDLFITQPVSGDRRYTKLFCWDLLEFALGRYLDLCGESGRSDDAGARELLLSMARQEAEVMWQEDGAGNRGVPYAWMRDGTPWGWEDSEVAVNVCNWHLLTADALAYAVIYGADGGILDRAREAFKTGSNPVLEYYRPEYTATKEATNSANFGLVYMSVVHPPDDACPVSEQFHEWLCLENPGDRDADVRVEYFLDGGGEDSQAVVVPAASRRTVSVNDAVGGGRDVAAVITSDRPVVAERPMYFDYHGVTRGGHCALGANQAGTDWYFAEGCTRPGFEQWMTVENPGEDAASVTLSYMLEGGGSRQQRVSVPGSSRTTIDVNGFLGPGQDVSTRLHSGLPVIAERPMYFSYRDGISGGHISPGAPAPATSWYFAEGTTRSNPDDGSYDEWLCMQNPGSGEAHVTASFMLGSGAEVRREYVLAPASRQTVSVDLAVGEGHDVSTALSSDAPIVAERPMYFSYRGALTGGHDAAGVTTPGTEWHFAEGCTRDGFQTWICLANPQSRRAGVTVEYFTAGGRRVSRELELAPRSRSTLDVNRDVGPGEDVSARVTSDVPIAAERPTYFNYQGSWDGGDVIVGARAPGTTWYFAEGCTR